MIAIKLTRHGGSARLALPEEALARLNVSAGDTVHLTETPDGFCLTSRARGADEKMSAAPAVVKKRRGARRALPK